MKAILVIDMTDECPNCYLCEQRNVYCLPVKRYVDDFENGKPSWCPLRPLPQLKNISDRKITYEELRERIGWNTCLDEITGETE